MDLIFGILFLCFISWFWFLNRLGKNRPWKLWKAISTFSLALLLFIILSGIVAIFNQKLPILMWILWMLFYVIIWLTWYWGAGVYLRKRKYKCVNCGQVVKFWDKECLKCWANLNKWYSQNKVKIEEKKNMTFWKRFWIYILYLVRDWIIYLIISAITGGFWIWRYDPFDDGHFAFDMFICFIIFVVETVRLISDCLKIKKWTYWK